MDVYGTSDGKDIGYVSIAVLTELVKEIVDQGVLSRVQMSAALNRAEKVLNGGQGVAVERAGRILRENLFPLVG